MSKVIRSGKYTFRVECDRFDTDTLETPNGDILLMRNILEIRMTSRESSSTYGKLFANLIGGEDGGGIFVAGSWKDFTKYFPTSVLSSEDRVPPDSWAAPHGRGKGKIHARQKVKGTHF